MRSVRSGAPSERFPAAIRVLHKAGLYPNKDLTVVLSGEVPTQPQALETAL